MSSPAQTLQLYKLKHVFDECGAVGFLMRVPAKLMLPIMDLAETVADAVAFSIPEMRCETSESHGARAAPSYQGLSGLVTSDSWHEVGDPVIVRAGRTNQLVAPIGCSSPAPRPEEVSVEGEVNAMTTATDAGARNSFEISREQATDCYRLDPVEAETIASAFSEAPDCRRDPKVVAAYEALQEQSDRFFRVLTDTDCPGAIQVAFTYLTNPYTNDQELIDAVRNERLLEVSAAASCSERLHPLLGCDLGGPYDRFRAVHDILGHVRTGLGFDRNGEYVAWRIQDQQYGGLARLALASELHAEHSVYWTSGTLPEHKACLLRACLIAWARVGQSASRPSPSGFPPNAKSAT